VERKSGNKKKRGTSTLSIGLKETNRGQVIIKKVRYCMGQKNKNYHKKVIAKHDGQGRFPLGRVTQAMQKGEKTKTDNLGILKGKNLNNK